MSPHATNLEIPLNVTFSGDAISVFHSQTYLGCFVGQFPQMFPRPSCLGIIIPKRVFLWFEMTSEALNHF